VSAVDVVIPVRDGGRLLRRAVDSVLSQEAVDVRVVVVDDHSSDKAPQRLPRDPRVVIVPSGASGIPAALETGIRLGTAPYVARQDADDVSLPGRLARQVRHLEEHPGIGLVATGFQVVVGNRVVATMAPGPAGFAQKNPLCAGSVMVRRAVHEQAGGYRSAFAQSSDYDMWFRCLELTGVSVLPEPGYRYRLTSAMTTIRRAGRQAAYAELARASARARSRQEPDPVLEAETFVAGLLQGAGPEPDPAVDAWWAREFAALGDRREALRCAWRAAGRLPTGQAARLLLLALGRPTGHTVWT
jgi:glycosyltransferase involved in cell wall biosynthesis